MPKPLNEFGLRIINGQNRSLIGCVVRGALAIVEPFYTAAMRLRNGCFDLSVKRIFDLGRPTISVGNITTGGTGKTPVVLWLTGQLRERGYRPAILLRGYGSANPADSDERQLLDHALNPAASKSIPVIANPSRVAGAMQVLIDHPTVDVFILDDGFQHRIAKRDFDLVLISATEPFGYGHVLPRGLLREPLTGLRRATAFLITRSSQADRSVILQTLSGMNPKAPVFRSDHVHSAVRITGTDQRVPVDKMSGEKVFLFAGIGDPESFARQLESAGCQIVGRRWFADHHPYTLGDIDELVIASKEAGAVWLLTTQKDWVKIAPLRLPAAGITIGVVELSIAFAGSDGQQLLEQIVKRLGPPAALRIGTA